MHRTPRRLAAAALATALFTLTACGSDSDSEGSDGSNAPDDTNATEGAFPVTIDHKYGSTTVEEEPERVVTVGLTDQDAVLALGTVPVGTTDWYGTHEAALGPWATDLLGDAELPTLLTDTGTGPQLEEIALLQPDVIIAQYAGLTQEQYDSLSEIAPVVAQPGEYVDYGVPWRQQTETIGRILGHADEAERLIADVDARFAEARAAHPEFADATAIPASPYEGYWVFGSEDPRGRMLADLGFTYPADVDAVIGAEFGANISEERTDLLDQGAIVWSVPDPEEGAEQLHQDPLYRDLAVVTEGREVFVEENSDFGVAYGFSSVLSLPYVLDQLVPQLAAAVDGDPATEVPAAQ
ncbi:iron-siderophore ABC transporter substrate-binding protein [Streptomyces hainanensis]|uniref:Iron-siderophore ABC transporter substrate-binding protein n=1 Tax=Streptomyces hainanensis TaxID=402648 RepID=A0A4R4TA00_9ACTN|nr:iron-siderophore ABC transporter substrate-binding protein [Streptomyces hainanensis]TDC73947.1 iron-siderophore ABC transporter substrate-binding protein [Streptomyces hainanensis]